MTSGKAISAVPPTLHSLIALEGGLVAKPLASTEGMVLLTQPTGILPIAGSFLALAGSCSGAASLTSFWRCGTGKSAVSMSRSAGNGFGWASGSARTSRCWTCGLVGTAAAII